MERSFGTSDAYSLHLGESGHEAMEVVANSEPLEVRWAGENGIGHKVRRLAARAPGPTGFVGGRAFRRIAFDQIRALDPNVVYLQDLWFFNRSDLRLLRGERPTVRRADRERLAAREDARVLRPADHLVPRDSGRLPLRVWLEVPCADPGDVERESESRDRAIPVASTTDRGRNAFAQRGSDDSRDPLRSRCSRSRFFSCTTGPLEASTPSSSCRSRSQRVPALLLRSRRRVAAVARAQLSAACIPREDLLWALPWAPGAALVDRALHAHGAVVLSLGAATGSYCVIERRFLARRYSDHR